MNTELPGPVVIGGVGGSGTRVLAEILIRSKFFMGSDLNRANDNLLFWLLFHRPRWFSRQSEAGGDDVFKGLNLLTKSITGRIWPSPADFAFLGGAVVDGIRLALRRPEKRRKIKRVCVRSWRLISSSEIDLSRFRGWGWKLPSSHFYLDYLDSYYPNLKYIHVMRHGLDMAFSRNQNQPRQWGEFFGLTPPESSRELPINSLDYWIRANQRALQRGKRMDQGKFLRVDFETLCFDPIAECTRIMRFLAERTTEDRISALSSIVIKPNSIGRHRRHDLTIFPRSSLQAVRELGYAF